MRTLCNPALPPYLRLTPVDGRSPRAGALGVALRHFTDQVRRYRSLGLADLHAATTVLTKQVEAELLSSRQIGEVADLLLDPSRVALSDGTTAAELLDDDWSDFAADIEAQVASTRAFTRLQGSESMLSLSAWYGTSDGAAWWGTPEWTTCLASYAETNRPGSRLLELLHVAPEVVDQLTLSRVLQAARLDRRSARAAQRRPISA